MAGHGHGIGIGIDYRCTFGRRPFVEIRCLSVVDRHLPHSLYEERQTNSVLISTDCLAVTASILIHRIVCPSTPPSQLLRSQTDEFGTDFNGLPGRHCFDPDFNGLSVRRNLPPLVRTKLDRRTLYCFNELSVRQFFPYHVVKLSQYWRETRFTSRYTPE